MITQELLKEYFEYREGHFYRKIVPKYSRNFVGQQVSETNNKNGYVFISVSGKSALMHRMVFLYHNGYLPEFIDHKDGDKLNNKIENLRPTTLLQNNYNSKMKTGRNKSGAKGVFWDKHKNRWIGRVSVSGKEVHVGTFTDFDEAVESVKLYREKVHGEFTNHG